MIIFLLVISLLILICSTLLTVFRNRVSGATKSIYILLSGAFLAAFVLMLYIDYKPDVHGAWATFFLAVFHTIQIMLLGYDYEFLYEAITLTDALSAVVYVYFAVLFVLLPIYTFGFVMSFFENVTAHIRCFLKRGSDIYIFSDLNSRSFTLARSVREKFGSAVIVFLNVSRDSDSSTLEFIDEAKSINSLLFKNDNADANLRLHSKTAKVTFFVISDEEAKNPDTSLKLIERYNTRDNTELYVFSDTKESEILLDSVSNGSIKVRRITETRSLAYNMIYNHPITKEITIADDKKIISTLIVGAGGYGTEFTKALLWCGQLPGYELEINIVDKDPHAKEKFEAMCPEIMKLNNNTAYGEARYALSFHNGVDVKTKDFYDIISKLTNTSCVYVALGNDELNIETAIQLRIAFERVGVYPVIRAIVYSDVKYEMLSNRRLANYRRESYDIEFIGNLGSRFSYASIINEELEQLALKCHLAWSNTPGEIDAAKKQFNEYEYYRNSSIATAIHEKYRRDENIPTELAAAFEHMRWNAYMRTEGYVFSGSLHSSSRNDRAKMHNNLHSYDKLSPEDIEKDIRIRNVKS